MDGYNTCHAVLAITLMAATSAALASGSTEPARGARAAPAPNCIDTRDVRRTYQGSDTTLAVIDGQGRMHRIAFAQACPGVDAASQVRMLAPAGWACGGPSERLQVDDRSCAVASVAVIDAREFAEDARESSRQQPATLPTVQVSAEAGSGRPQRRSFIPSHTFCFANRNVRGWHEDGEGIVVLTSPRRSGGNSQYRVETGGSCPDLARAPAVVFESGLDNGMVCGNPGDRVVAASSQLSGLADDFRQSYSRQIESQPVSVGCQITAVYPKR